MSHDPSLDSEDPVERFMAHALHDPAGHCYAVAFSLVWLRIMSELVAAGIPWPDAVYACSPAELDQCGLVTGLRWGDDTRADAVREKWDTKDAMESAVRDGVNAFRKVIEDIDDTGTLDERVRGLALCSLIWIAAGDIATSVRESGAASGKVAEAFLSFFAAAEVKADTDGFPVAFLGHGQILADGSLELPAPPDGA